MSSTDTWKFSLRQLRQILARRGLTRRKNVSDLSTVINQIDDNLLEFLVTYKCFRLPSHKTVRTTVMELAQRELIQRPCYIATCWASVVDTLNTHGSFHSVKQDEGTIF